MMISRWEDHGQLSEGQLVTDAAGKLWQVYKPRSQRRPGRPETWLLPFSDEYAFTMGDHEGAYPLGDDAPFPLTVVKVMPDDRPTEASCACRRDRHSGPCHRYCACSQAV